MRRGEEPPGRGGSVPTRHVPGLGLGEIGSPRSTVEREGGYESQERGGVWMDRRNVSGRTRGGGQPNLETGGKKGLTRVGLLTGSQKRTLLQEGPRSSCPTNLHVEDLLHVNRGKKNMDPTQRSDGCLYPSNPSNTDM